jgi:hypothetical protein
MDEREVVINRCFGGFGLSPRAVEAYLARQGKECFWFVDARDENGRLQLRGQKVPTDDPDGVFIAYSYTSPDASEDSYFYARDIERDDPDLVAVVRELGKDADGTHAELAIVSIPGDADWFIDEYDGQEHIAEKHRTWR